MPRPPDLLELDDRPLGVLEGAVERLEDAPSVAPHHRGEPGECALPAGHRTRFQARDQILHGHAAGEFAKAAQLPLMSVARYFSVETGKGFPSTINVAISKNNAI